VQLTFSLPGAGKNRNASVRNPRQDSDMTTMQSEGRGGGAVRRLTRLDWPRIAHNLDASGHSVISGLLHGPDCRLIRGWYDDDARFRSRVVMASHGFGRGEYKYFSYPLPQLLASLRAACYRQLAPIANRWNERLAVAQRFPGTLSAFLARCHAAGQPRPTPLMLHYGAGDYNCLHQDLYGEWVFPLQVTILLSQPGEDFSGGEFVLTEQRPRMQSRATVVPLCRGDAVIFAVHHRPVAGRRGTYRVNLRHGVSPVRSGERRTLGIIFHDAK
jgi:uncharacterized protein